VNLAYKVSGNEPVLSGPNFYICLYVFFHYPALFFVESSFFVYVAAVNLGLVGFVGGLYFASMDVSAARVRATQLSPISHSPRRYVYVMLILGVAVSLIYYKGLPPSFNIFVNFFSGRSVIDQLLGVSAYRAELTKSHYFGGEYSGQGAMKIVNEVLWQLIAVFMFIRAGLSEGRAPWVHFGIALILSVLFIYGVGAKAPVAFVFVGLLAATTFCLRVKTATLLKMGFVFFALLVVIQSVQISRFHWEDTSSFFGEVIAAVFDRISQGNGYNSYRLIDLISSGVVDFLYGQEHLTKLLNSIPGVQYGTPFAHELYFLTAETVKEGKTTYSSFSYLGVMYLDFGLVGVFAFSIAIGYLMQKAHQFMVKNFTRDVLGVSLTAVLSVYIGKTALGSVLSIIPTLYVALGIWMLISFSKFVRAARA